MISLIDTPDYAGVSPGGDHPATITLNSTIFISPLTDLQIAQDAWKLLISTHPSTMLVPQPIQRPLTMTITNTRANNPWGDELSTEAKIPGHLRVYASNVNGLRLDARGGQFDTLCKVHKEVQADIMCGQEHNLDTTQMPVRTILYKTAIQHWQRHRLVFGTSPISFASHHKPGGTFILMTGNVTSRVIKQDRDKWGAG